MTDVPIRRRRWLWLGLIAGLLGLGTLVFWSFRPLNSEERHLVGTWRTQAHRMQGSYTFTADRRFTFVVGAGRRPLAGSWSLSKGRLTYYFNDQTEPLRSRITTFARNLWDGFPNVKHWSIVFESTDRMEVTLSGGLSGAFDRDYDASER